MINVQLESRHKEFFGLLSLHSFFHDGFSRDLSFQPTAETARELKNLGLVFKELPFGFIVLYYPEYSIQRLMEAAPKTRFSFRITRKNSKFLNYTDLPFLGEGQAFHYSNIQLHDKESDLEIPEEVYYFFKELRVADVKKKLLHLPEHPVVSVRPRKFSESIAATEKSTGIAYDDLVIADEFGDSDYRKGQAYKKSLSVIRKGELKRLIDHETQKAKREGLVGTALEQRIEKIRKDLIDHLGSKPEEVHKFDFGHVPYGKYRMHLGKKGSQHEVYVTENPGENALGYVDIYLETAQNALLNRNANLESEAINPQLYHLDFQPRETFWRYYFFQNEDSQVVPKSIRDESESISFSEPSEGMLESVGKKAMISISSAPVPLQERPKYALFLERMNGMRSMKELRLPTPRADGVRPGRGEDKINLYSDVFVYL